MSFFYGGFWLRLGWMAAEASITLAVLVVACLAFTIYLLWTSPR